MELSINTQVVESEEQRNNFPKVIFLIRRKNNLKILDSNLSSFVLISCLKEFRFSSYPISSPVHLPVSKMTISRVLMFQCLRMALVAPCWSHLEWFPDLLNLLVDLSREVPSWHPLCRCHRSRRYYLDVLALNLVT